MLLNTEYTPEWWLRSGHVQSIYATLCSPRHTPKYTRERISTDDGDFLDLDWAYCGADTDSLVILSHGLEGHSKRNYITGMIASLHKASMDCVAWNQRGCSGEINRCLRLYHNGVIDDLECVIDHAISLKKNGLPKYKRIFLVGFSMGANLTLLYLGKESTRAQEKITAAVTFSVPSDLSGAGKEIGRAQNALYMKRFLIDLKSKILAKEQQFPDKISSAGYSQLKTFKDFDGRYTAPIHGFSSAEDYWKKCSSLPWFGHIKVPTLIVNALDDSFLSPSCYPKKQVEKNPALTMLTPKHGGHVGFVLKNEEKEYWSEKVCRDFIMNTPCTA